MTEALHAEWTKLRTLAGTWWLLVGVVAVTVAATAALAASTHVSPGSAGGRQDPTKLALTGVDLGQAVVVVLAILAISEEYGTGMIRTSLAAMPRRQMMLAAKAINIICLTLIAGLPAVAGCLVAGHLLLPGARLDPAHGYALISIAHGPTLRAALGCVLYLGLIALLSLAIAAIVRDTAASTGVVFGLLYLPPLLAQLVSGPWHRHLEQIAPMSAGLTVQSTSNPRALPIAPWAGLGVLAAWAVGALLVGGVALQMRDA